MRRAQAAARLAGMNDAPLVFFATSLVARLATAAFGVALIVAGVALWRATSSLWLAGMLILGGVAVAGYGLVTREISLMGTTLRCGTPNRNIALADFTDVRETTRTERGPRNEFRGDRVQLVLTGPDGRTATCQLYHRLAPAERERLLAEIRTRLRA